MQENGRTKPLRKMPTSGEVKFFPLPLTVHGHLLLFSLDVYRSVFKCVSLCFWTPKISRLPYGMPMLPCLEAVADPGFLKGGDGLNGGDKRSHSDRAHAIIGHASDYTAPCLERERLPPPRFASP